MAIEVLELHHHGIRVGPTPDAVKKAHDFYHTVLGLSPDPGPSPHPGRSTATGWTWAAPRRSI